MIILSEARASAYEPSDREVCISITDPNKPLPTLSGQFLAVLRVCFSDITEAIDHPDYALFDAQHAAAVVRFARTWRDVDRIVVHCRAGMSRSPGVAMGLCDLFSWPLGEMEQQYPGCNRWVRRELRRTGRELLQTEQ